MYRWLCSLPLLACADPQRTTSDVTTDQAAAYRAQLMQLETVAAQYDRAMAKASATTCIPVHRTYDRSARDIITRADELDAELDAAVIAHGGSPYADVACTTAALMVELDYHGAVACQELAFEDNVAEATRHLLVLGTQVDHALGRTAEIVAGLATESATWTWTLPTSCP